MDYSEMQAQQKLGSLVYRGSRGSLKRTENSSVFHPSPMSSSAPPSIGSELEMSGLGQHESEMSRSRPSLSSLRSSCSQFRGDCSHYCSSPSDSAFFGEGVEIPAPFLKVLFFLVTVLNVDKVLSTAVSILRDNIHRIPCLMYFKFVQVLVKRGNDSIADSLSEMTNCSSNTDDCLGTSRSFEIRNAVAEACTYEQLATPVTIVTANDNEEHDDYGFFADFEEEAPAHTDLHKDLFQSLGGSRSSITSSLCTLAEEAEEEE
mmetsp:Transcript_5476/g.9024  ORF Transcript_5476/g.9024 Transcript_5476/m.9024 type:complete len:261 (-) Transcript_5476:29-811(-)